MDFYSQIVGKTISILSSNKVHYTGKLMDFNVKTHKLLLHSVDANVGDGIQRLYKFLQFRLLRDILSMKLVFELGSDNENPPYFQVYHFTPYEFHEHICNNNCLVQMQPFLPAYVKPYWYGAVIVDAAKKPAASNFHKKCRDCGFDIVKQLKANLHFDIFCSCSLHSHRYAPIDLTSDIEEFDFEKGIEEFKRLSLEGDDGGKKSLQDSGIEIAESFSSNENNNGNDKNDSKAIFGESFEMDSIEPVYDKNKSFFDNSTCDGSEARLRICDWRQWNRETFGDTALTTRRLSLRNYKTRFGGSSGHARGHARGQAHGRGNGRGYSHGNGGSSMQMRNSFRENNMRQYGQYYGQQSEGNKENYHRESKCGPGTGAIPKRRNKI